MAVEADCGVPTVLEALRVTRTSRFPVPGECGEGGWQCVIPNSEFRIPNSAPQLAYTSSRDRLFAAISAGPLGRAPPDA